ncbi:MAG: DUF4359 domain-containing protein [Chitinophagales bacterium]|nr:DUF4359 domain-containing protein [Chitinophagales bacterium]
MKRSYLITAIIGVLVLIAILTNPNQDKHKSAIKNKFYRIYQQSIKENYSEDDNEWAQAGQAIGMAFGNIFIDGIIDNLVSSDNYILFSLTKVTWNGDTKVVGLGAFGNVYISKQLDEKLKEKIIDKQ